jgi:hypothetical protein
MGIWSGTKKAASHLVNVRVDKWIAYSYLKDTLNFFLDISKSLFKPEHTQIQESFEEATKRLHLNSEDLIQRATLFQRFTFIFLVITLGLLIYAIYIFQQNNLMGTCMTICLALYAGYQAFKFHFWRYQIQKQRLGCSLKECLYASFRKNV